MTKYAPKIKVGNKWLPAIHNTLESSETEINKKQAEDFLREKHSKTPKTSGEYLIVDYPNGWTDILKLAGYDNVDRAPYFQLVNSINKPYKAIKGKIERSFTRTEKTGKAKFANGKAVKCWTGIKKVIYTKKPFELPPAGEIIEIVKSPRPKVKIGLPVKDEDIARKSKRLMQKRFAKTPQITVRVKLDKETIAYLKEEYKFDFGKSNIIKVKLDLETSKMRHLDNALLKLYK